MFASPAGGKAPLDPSSVEAFKEDAVTVGFLNDPLTKHAVENTLKLADVNHTDFLAIFYVGGHGPVFDLATDQTNIALAEAFLAAGKPVGALCHGPAALSNVKSNGGESIFKGRRVTCFSNQEEEMVGLAKAIPFLPETDIVAKGGIFVKERQPWVRKKMRIMWMGGWRETDLNEREMRETCVKK